MICHRFIACFLVVQFAGIASAQSKPRQVRLKQETKVAFTEGPAWRPTDQRLLFSDVVNNRIMMWTGEGAAQVYRDPSGRANGLLFDAKGRLYACEGAAEGGNRRVTRTELDGSVTVLTDTYHGHRYNAPNDLAFDSRGRVYFTDPRYGDRSDMQIVDESGKPIEGVYRIDEVGQVVRILSHEVDRPNGIAISAEDRYLFVADNNNSAAGYNRKLWRFDLSADGSAEPASRKLLFDWGTERGPDGMTLDRKGRLFVAAGRNFQISETETTERYKAAIYIIDQDGKLLDTIPVPMDDITNCSFGGPDGKTLYITSGHKIWSIPVDH